MYNELKSTSNKTIVHGKKFASSFLYFFGGNENSDYSQNMLKKTDKQFRENSVWFWALNWSYKRKCAFENLFKLTLNIKISTSLKYFLVDNNSSM